MTAKEKVKKVYPDAYVSWGYVQLFPWALFSDNVLGVWSGTPSKCIDKDGAYRDGYGKKPTPNTLWQRAWKKIQRETLEKLSA